MIERLAIVIAVFIGLAVVLTVQHMRKKPRVLEIVPSYKNADIIGDGAWFVPPADTSRRSALIRDMQEPRGA